MVDMSKNGFGQSGQGTLKLSEELNDGTNCFFACWYTFKKAKSYFSNFWVSITI